MKMIFLKYILWYFRSSRISRFLGSLRIAAYSNGGKYVFLLILVFFLISCSDSLTEGSHANSKSSIDAIVLHIDAGNGFSTRAIENGVEDYEDYINPENLKILFFDADGKFLFDATDNEIDEETDIEEDENRTHLKVTVQIDNMKDNNDENAKSIANTIRQQLKDNPFKVVVLANWPETPNWGYTESKFYSENNCKTINDLHNLNADKNIINDENPVYSTWMKKQSEGFTGFTTLEMKIPMFGVQDFDAIGIWINGSTIDLRTSQNENTISLIRSVAKVELYFYSKPTEVILYNMNPKAFCEPMDVYTSTSVSWGKDHKKDKCEWFTVQGHGLWETINYEDWFAWFYESRENQSNGTETINFPRIFHPTVENGLNCNFIYVGQEKGLYKYLLYVPEKCIADPDENYIPKIPYVNYSYDSHDFFRIYFTNYNQEDASLGPINKNVPAPVKDDSVYEEYESDTNNDNLSKHWPIMRNHVYRFIIQQKIEDEDSEPIDQVINVLINPWEYHPDDSWEEIW